MKALFSAALLCLLGACQPLTGSITDEQAQNGPQMRVQIRSRGADATLLRVASNDDVVTWLTVDNISLSFRQGVLVATRGLGHDLMGADASATLGAFEGLGDPVYRRQMRYLTADNQTTYLMASCEMARVADEAIKDKVLARFDEKCIARQHSFTNIYWKNEDGVIVDSRQWVSPEIGYIRNSIMEQDA